MTEFTIYCTKDQTKKALELGAELLRIDDTEEIDYSIIFGTSLVIDKGDYITYNAIPTAEQMIGWLRTKGIKFHFDDATNHWLIGTKDIYPMTQGFDDTQKELAAIDAALDYLTNEKKQL